MARRYRKAGQLSKKPTQSKVIAASRVGYKIGKKLYNAYSSYTSQKNKNLSKVLNSGSYSSGKSRSRSGSKKPVAKWMKNFPLQLNYFNNSGLLKWTNGIQDYAFPAQILTGSMLAQWYQNFPDASLTATNNNRFLIHIQDVSGSIMLKNQANAQAKITMYECMYKKTTVENAITLVQAGTANKFNVGIPTNDIKYKLLNMQPYFSGTFNEHCKIVSTKSIILDPGQVHEHTFFYSYNRNFAVGDYFKELSASTEFIGGWTRFFLIRCSGTPDSDVAGTGVSSSSGKVIFVTTQKCNYRLINQQKEKAAFNLAQIAPIGSEKIMGEDTDTVMNYTEA